MSLAVSLRRRYGIKAFALALILLPGFAVAQSFTHVHLRTPDPAAAAEWYHTLVGGELRPAAGGMGSVGQIHGSISTMLDDAGAQPSGGSVIDHFGFAVADVRGMVEKARIMGAQVVAEPHPGVTANSIAMIQDPWGTKVELLEDPDYTGIQHVHMVTEGVEVLRDWMLEVFGGDYDPERGGGRFHAIQYDGIWVYLTEAQEGSTVSTVPSRGRSLDHMGFAVTDMDAIVAKIEASGYEPYVIRPNRPGGTTLLMFFEGANGVHFEISQPGGAQ